MTSKGKIVRYTVGGNGEYDIIWKRGYIELYSGGWVYREQMFQTGSNCAEMLTQQPKETPPLLPSCPFAFHSRFRSTPGDRWRDLLFLYIPHIYIYIYVWGKNKVSKDSENCKPGTLCQCNSRVREKKKTFSLKIHWQMSENIFLSTRQCFGRLRGLNFKSLTFFKYLNRKILAEFFFTSRSRKIEQTNFIIVIMIIIKKKYLSTP